jgi:hypothetical protein
MDIVQVAPIHAEGERDSIPDIETPETMILNAIPTDTYESIVYDFQITRHESALDAQHFYLDYCLIPFLFQHNKQIREYISNKDEQWKQSFGELLK